MIIYAVMGWDDVMPSDTKLANLCELMEEKKRVSRYHKDKLWVRNSRSGDRQVRQGVAKSYAGRWVR